MITAVDTNVLLDLFLDDPSHGEASASLLRQCKRQGVLVASDIVWAECAAVFPGQEAALEAMGLLGIKFVPTTMESASRAGKAWRLYRERGGPRERVVADFLIGAHALLQCDHLLTRDRGFYRSYFKNLTIIDPSISTTCVSGVSP